MQLIAFVKNWNQFNPRDFGSLIFLPQITMLYFEIRNMTEIKEGKESDHFWARKKKNNNNHKACKHWNLTDYDIYGWIDRKWSIINRKWVIQKHAQNWMTFTFFLILLVSFFPSFFYLSFVFLSFFYLVLFSLNLVLSFSFNSFISLFFAIFLDGLLWFCLFICFFLPFLPYF